MTPPKGISAAELARDADGNIPRKDPGPVIKLARELVNKENKIAALKLQIVALEEERLAIAKDKLPAAMRDCGVTSLGLAAGWELELEEIFSANLPAPSTIENAKGEEIEALIDRSEKGMEWLEENGGGDLLVETVSVKLGRGQSRIAQKLVELATKLKVIPKRARKIDPRTLAKFLKEKISNGADVPLETFAVFSAKVAVITRPKEEKEKIQNGTTAKKG